MQSSVACVPSYEKIPSYQILRRKSYCFFGPLHNVDFPSLIDFFRPVLSYGERLDLALAFIEKHNINSPLLRRCEATFQTAAISCPLFPLFHFLLSGINVCRRLIGIWWKFKLIPARINPDFPFLFIFPGAESGIILRTESRLKFRFGQKIEINSVIHLWMTSLMTSYN